MKPLSMTLVKMALLLTILTGTALSQSDVSNATTRIPTFFSRQDYVGLTNRWTSVADMNGDGIPDMIGLDCETIIVQFGNGNGTF